MNKSDLINESYGSGILFSDKASNDASQSDIQKYIKSLAVKYHKVSLSDLRIEFDVKNNEMMVMDKDKSMDRCYVVIDLDSFKIDVLE